MEKTLDFIKKKAPQEISRLSRFLNTSRLAIFLITRKRVGKSTYIDLFNLLFPGKFANLSAGELVRCGSAELKKGKSALERGLKATFPQNLKAITLIRDFSVKTLLPPEVIGYLLKRELKKIPQEKSLFIDGFPRSPGQLPFTEKLLKKFKAEGRETLFIQIDLADGILEERKRSRRVCPKCKTTGNISSPIGGTVDYSLEKEEFILRCDRPSCQGEEMVRKAGFAEEMEDLRTREKLLLETAKELKKRYEDGFIFLRSDIPTREFKGEEVELNHISKFSFKDGKIIKRQGRQTAVYNGEKVYSLEPRGAMPMIVKAIIEKLGI